MIKFWKRNKVSLGKLYACTAGTYAGQFLIFIREKSDEYGFLSTPSMKNLWVPKEKFDFGIKNDILKFVENVPKNVTEVARAQFEENERGFQLQSPN